MNSHDGCLGWLLFECTIGGQETSMALIIQEFLAYRILSLCFLLEKAIGAYRHSWLRSCGAVSTSIGAYTAFDSSIRSGDHTTECSGVRVSRASLWSLSEQAGSIQSLIITHLTRSFFHKVCSIRVKPPAYQGNTSRAKSPNGSVSKVWSQFVWSFV